MRKEQHQKKTSAKHRDKKLKLNKETIKDLEPEKSSAVKGGLKADTSRGCGPTYDYWSCNCTK